MTCHEPNESLRLEEQLEPRPGTLKEAAAEIAAVVKEFFSWDHSDKHEQIHEQTQD